MPWSQTGQHGPPRCTPRRGRRPRIVNVFSAHGRDSVTDDSGTIGSTRAAGCLVECAGRVNIPPGQSFFLERPAINLRGSLVINLETFSAAAGRGAVEQRGCRRTATWSAWRKGANRLRTKSLCAAGPRACWPCVMPRSARLTRPKSWPKRRCSADCEHWPRWRIRRSSAPGCAALPRGSVSTGSRAARRGKCRSTPCPTGKRTPGSRHGGESPDRGRPADR